MFILIVVGAGLYHLHRKLTELEGRIASLKGRLGEQLSEFQTTVDRRIASETARAPAPLTRDEVVRITGQASLETAARVDQLQGSLDGQIQRLMRELTDLESTKIDEIRQRLASLENRPTLAQTEQPNPYETRPAPVSPVAVKGDPLVELARSVATIQRRLAQPRSQTVKAGPAELGMARSLDGTVEAVRSLEASLAGRSSAGSGETAQLATRVRAFASRVRQAAGLDSLAGVEAGAPSVPTVEEWIAAGRRGLQSESSAGPGNILAAYLGYACRGQAASTEPVSDAAVGEREFRDQVYGFVNATHELRLRLGEREGAMVAELDRLFEALRDVLRLHYLTVIAPMPGESVDPATMRVSGTVARRDLPSKSVASVIACGLKDSRTGELLKPAEVTTVS